MDIKIGISKVWRRVPDRVRSIVYREGKTQILISRKGHRVFGLDLVRRSEGHM